RELRVVEDADAIGIEISCHPVRIANPGQRPSDHHAIVARQHATDPPVVPIRQRLGHAAPRQVTFSPGSLHHTYWFRLCRLRGGGCEPMRICSLEEAKSWKS